MCRHGEPGIFPHMSTIKGRKWVAIERLNCAWAYPRLGTEKNKTKVAGNLLHVSIAIGGRISYTPSVERIVDWTTRKILPFGFSPNLVNYVMFSRKDTRLSPRYTFAFQGSLGTRLAQPVVLFTQKSTLTFGELLSCRTVCVNACHASNSATTAIDNQYVCTTQLWSWTAIRRHFVCTRMYNSTVCEAMSASSSYNEQTALMKQLLCNFT